LEVFELDSEYKVFTDLGTIIHNETLMTAEDVGKLLVEIASDLPGEEMTGVRKGGQALEAQT